jgi:predicted Zn-dependent protease
MLSAWSCTGASRPTPPPPPVAGEPLARRELAFLADPAASYPLLIDGRRQAEVRAAHRALVDEGEMEGAAQRARELLAVDPGFHPARVLAAQVDFAAGRLAAAREALRAVVDELPGYPAAQLLLGRVHESLGEIVEAYAAYRAASRDSEAALQRGEELLPRALEITGNRVREALRRGHLETAEAELARLLSWGPESTVALDAAREVATARGDLAAELSAVAILAERFPDRRDLA